MFVFNLLMYVQESLISVLNRVLVPSPSVDFGGISQMILSGTEYGIAMVWLDLKQYLFLAREYPHNKIFMYIFFYLASSC